MCLDPNCWPTGDCERHLRAAVIVQLSHPRATHSSVGVSPSFCLSVSETPDVALWMDRRLEKVNKHPSPQLYL